MSKANILAKIEPRRPLGSSGGITLPANYQYDGKVQYLTRANTIATFLKDGEFPGDIRFKDIDLTHLVKSQGDKHLDAKLISFWKDHPDVIDVVRSESDPEYSEKKQKALFSITVLQEQKMEKKKQATTYHEATQLIYGMDPLERREVLFYFNIDNRHMDDDDVLVTLVDPQAGKVRSTEFRDELLTGFGKKAGSVTTEKVAMISSLHKGIIEGYVTFKNSKYYIDGDLLGHDSDDAVHFFRENPRVYTNLVRSLAKKGDAVAQANVAGLPGAQKLVVTDEVEGAALPSSLMTKFKDLANSYGLKTHNVTKFETLAGMVHSHQAAKGIPLTPAE